MSYSRILNFTSRIFIKGTCEVALAPTMIIINGFYIPTLISNIFCKWLIFVQFVVIVSDANLSLQYVNSIYCILRLLSGPIGEFDWYGNPLMHMRSSLNLALH